MDLDLYGHGHATFCLNPLHPGPCKGWKKNNGGGAAPSAPKKAAAPKAPKAPAAPKAPTTKKATAKKVPAGAGAGADPGFIKPAAEIGKPSKTGRADLAVAPEKMTADWKAHWSTLDAKQKQAAREYSGGGYYSMNGLLRAAPGSPEATNPDPETLAEIRDLQSAMAPAPRGTKVFRGMHAKGLGLPDEPTLAQVQALVGSTLVNDAFTSTTVDRQAAFHGNIKLQIEVPKGTPSLYLGDHSAFPTEKELLLAAGAKMKILGVERDTKNPDNYIVKARIVQ